MVNVAILNAIKYKRKIAQNDDFDFALDRISMGYLIVIYLLLKVLEEKI